MVHLRVRPQGGGDLRVASQVGKNGLAWAELGGSAGGPVSMWPISFAFTGGGGRGRRDRSIVQLRSQSDVEVRINGVALLGLLLRNLSDEQMRDTYASLLSSFEEWRTSHPGPLELQDGRDREAALEHGTVSIFLQSCSYVRDPAQATAGFHAVSAALASKQLDVSTLMSVAGLLRVLAEPERGQAVSIIIAGLADPEGWYSRGSGRYIPANYAEDALQVIEPLLTQDEIQRAIAALTSQSDRPYYGEVFVPTIERLQRRLADAG